MDDRKVEHTHVEPSGWKIEFDAAGNHRLVNPAGQRTRWTGYRGFTYLDGMVGSTAFYHTKECVLTADEFCKQCGVGKEN